MALSLPTDVHIEILEWLHPVQVMQLRSVCRAWREEAAPKAIRVVGLIDDFESNGDAAALQRSFRSANRGWHPLPGDGRWKGKFPALSFPSFHVLPNVRRVETEPTHGPWSGREGAKAVADVCATWPDLEEIVTAAMPPRGRTIEYWTFKNERPEFTALDLIRELRDRCPKLRVLSFHTYPSRVPKPKEIIAFAKRLARLHRLEVLDATEIGMDANTAGRVLLKCVGSFPKLRVFVAPEYMDCLHQLFPALLQNAPLLEELHIPTRQAMESRRCYESGEPLVEALRAHGGLRVLTLHGTGGGMSSEMVVSAIEALPKLHTCSAALSLPSQLVDRIAAVLRRGVLKRMAIMPWLIDCAQMERFVGVLREVNVRPLLRFPRKYYYLDMEVEGVSADLGEYPDLDEALKVGGSVRAGERWALKVEGGYLVVRMLEDDSRMDRKRKISVWKVARATWPDADMHRFVESQLGDPRLVALGIPSPAASTSAGATR